MDLESLRIRIDVDFSGASAQIALLNRQISLQMRQIQTSTTHSVTTINRQLGNIGGGATRAAIAANTASIQRSFGKLALGIGAMFASLQIGKTIANSIQDAANDIESENLFAVSFKDNQGAGAEITEWTNTLQTQLGLNAVQMRNNVGLMYTMSESMGVTSKAAVGLSRDTALLANDMASFYNIKPDQAFDKLRAGLTGEIEGLQRLGININEAAVKQELVRLGVEKVNGEYEMGAKVMARYNLIMQQTKNAQGDLARTIDSPANQMRKLQTELQLLSIAFGYAFLPILQTVIPILSTLINYLTVTMKYIASFMSALFKAAGFNLKKTVVDETKYSNTGGKADVKSSVAAPKQGVGVGVDSAVGGANKLTKANNAAAGSYDKVGKAAKKTQDNLQGFDEIHQLKQINDAAGAGSPSGGAGGGAEMPAMPTAMDDALAASKVTADKMINEINAKLKAFANNPIFDPLKKAFNELWVAVKPVLDNLGKGLKWLLDNILVPLSIWTITEALPAFLHACAGAMKVVNPLMEVLAKVALDVWNNWLKPIAVWSGGLFVKALTEVGDALIVVGNWMKDNEKLLVTVTKLVIEFMAAWKVIEILAFIQTSGGLIMTLGLITRAVFASTIAKIADSIQLAINTALYAKDFIVAMARSTASIIVQTGRWITLTAIQAANAIATGIATVATAAWNVVCVIATTVTSAFGVAMAFLTSPIGLVVLAIGAVIAIGILLYKNWDKIKAGASTAFNSIKNTVEDIVNGLERSIMRFVDKVTGFFRKVKEAIFGAKQEAADSSDYSATVSYESYSNVTGIPHFATGGIVDRPTIAQIGEAGKEAVVPLENTSFVTTLASAVGNAVAGSMPRGGGNSNSGTGDVTVILRLNELELGKAVTKAQNKYSRLNGNTNLVV